MDRCCSKCGKPKPPTEYYTYYHSTQKVYRTRRVCNTCFKEQKLKYKESIKETIIVQPDPPELEIEPIIDYSTNPDYKKCATCQEYRVLDDFYNFKQSRSNKYYRQGSCKECVRTRENNRSKQERIELLEEQGGSEKILAYPNQYMDEYQKKFTFNLMKNFGWIFNEEKEIWYKPGVKDENGVWDKIKNSSTKPRRIEKHQNTRLKRYEIRQMVTPDNLPKLKVKESRVTSGVTEEIVNQMVYDYFINKMKLKELQNKYNYDYQMIGYYVDKIYSLF